MTSSRLLASVALAVLLCSCSGGGRSSSHGAPPAPPTTGAVVGPTDPPTTQVTIPASEIADPGLPSQVGPAPLTTAVLTKLMQYFEDNVAQAYKAGDADALYHYLAGSMLTGNRATINLLDSRNQRNVYQITVQSVTLDTSDPDRVVFDMSGDMPINYFFDPTTNTPLDNGLSTAGPVDFEIFIDYNPANHTWYWTGEQNLDQSSSTPAAGTG
jgi:hypothetical protein